MLEIVHLSGRRTACSFNAGPIRDEAGQITGAVVMFRDVTEERRMQAALDRQSEERYRAIVETARDYAIFTVDAEGLIETWPAGAESVFGWIAAEAVGQPYSMTFTPEDRTWGIPEAELRTAREKGQAPNVRWHQRRDGSHVFIEGIVRPLTDTDGAVTGYVKVGQDITERRATEEALRASETRLRLAIGAGRIGEWELDVVTDTSVRAHSGMTRSSDTTSRSGTGASNPLSAMSCRKTAPGLRPRSGMPSPPRPAGISSAASGGRTMARYAGSQPTASRSSG